MLRVFAASGTQEREYYPLWSFYFNGSTYPLDYHSDTNFVREAPTPFDLLAASRRLLAWTGDASYATDAGLWAAWTNTVGPFVALHDPLGQGVAGQADPTGNIFEGGLVGRCYRGARDTGSPGMERHWARARANMRCRCGELQRGRRAAHPCRGRLRQAGPCPGLIRGHARKGRSASGAPQTGNLSV